jgi:hypothetical protein
MKRSHQKKGDWQAIAAAASKVSQAFRRTCTSQTGGNEVTRKFQFNINRNTLAKMALIIAGIALAVPGAWAGPNNNNLILSINNNNNGGTTEFTVNLGNASGYTSAQANLDISSFVGTFKSQYIAASASGLNAGVVAGQNGQGGLTGASNDVFTTLRTGGGSYLNPGTEGAPANNPSKALIANAGGITGGFSGYGSNLAINDPTSFTANIAQDPSTAGTAGSSFVGYLGQPANPLQTMTGNTIVLDLWKDTVTASGTTGWKYVGNFTFDNSGATATLVWNSTSGGGGGSNPPPKPVLSLSTLLSAQSGQVTSTISFNTTNGATYTLYFTNAAGLKTPLTNWPSLTTTITGDGTIHSFTNTSTDPNRFYSVGAH